MRRPELSPAHDASPPADHAPGQPQAHRLIEAKQGNLKASRARLWL